MTFYFIIKNWARGKKRKISNTMATYSSGTFYLIWSEENYQWNPGEKRTGVAARLIPAHGLELRCARTLKHQVAGLGIPAKMLGVCRRSGHKSTWLLNIFGKTAKQGKKTANYIESLISWVKTSTMQSVYVLCRMTNGSAEYVYAYILHWIPADDGNVELSTNRGRANHSKNGIEAQ